MVYTVNMKLCECGCGKKIKHDKHYCSGHNRRGRGNYRYLNQGYIRIGRVGDNHRVYEHNIIMEKYLGRILKKGELVHHKNGIKTDNRIENLELTTISEHMKTHYPQRVIDSRGRFTSS